MSISRPNPLRGNVRAILIWLKEHAFIIGQLIIAIIAIAGGYLHAFPMSEKAEHENYPVVDAITLGWVGLFLVAISLQRITEITLGGTSLKFREVKEGAQQFETAIGDIANLAQNWSTSAAIYIGLISNSRISSSDRDKLFADYLRDRMGEALQFLSEAPDEDIRIALWLYDPVQKKLVFTHSNEFIPTQTSYAVGEGLIGKAFQENRRFNEPDVRNVPGYKATRTGDPPYRAILCRPVILGKEVIGMLTADKRQVSLFTDLADEILRGLAAQCAIAVDQRRKFS